MREVVIQEFQDLRQVGQARLRVRVIRVAETRPGIFLDIRTYVDSPAFTGWTRRGIRVDGEEFSALLEQGNTILEALTSGQTVTQRRARRNK
jgi:hypothetical protein